MCRCAGGLAAVEGNERRVREESHLNDMRAAIRGDFERLAKRRGTQELMQEPEVAAEPEQCQEPAPGLAAESIAESSQPPAPLEMTQDIAPEPARVGGPAEEPPEAPLEVDAPVEEAATVEAALVEEAASLGELPVEGAQVEEAVVEEPPRRGFFARLLGL